MSHSKMDGEESVSHILMSLMNSLGLDEEQRQKRITIRKMAQLLANFSNPQVPFLGELLSGSSYETTTIDGLSSDLDVMYVFKAARVIADIKDFRDDGIITYLMDNTGCYSSFVKLRLLKMPHDFEGSLKKLLQVNDFPRTLIDRSHDFSGIIYAMLCQLHEKDSNGNMLLTNRLARALGVLYNLFDLSKGEMNGPAYTAIHCGQERDHVSTLPCKFFPIEATKWKQRQTPLTRTRIDPAIIDDSKHCYVVAVGDKNSTTEHLQWRLTFSHIEHKLIHAWNNVQYQCYILMKMILKGVIKEKIPETICSYHLKTIMLWMNEEYPAEFFVASYFEQCVLACMKNLADAARKRLLPHYFMTACNLFHPKLTNNIDTAMKLVAIVEEIIAEWPTCLFRISLCGLGERFGKCFTGNSALSDICGSIMKIRRENLGNSRSLYEISTEFHSMEWRIFAVRDALVKNSKDSIGHLCKLRKMGASSNHNDEHRQLIDHITNEILCNISLERIRYNKSMSNKASLENVTAGLRYIKRYSNSCCMDTGLKIAAHFVVTGNHSQALSLLDRVQAQASTIRNFRCYHDYCGDIYPLFGREVVFDNRPTLTDYCQHYIGAAVKYSRQNMSHIPKGLVYEMFRSTSVSPLSDPYLYRWQEQTIIHCPVYLHYLQFLSHHAQGRSDKRQDAQDNMEKAAKQISLCTHRETNHNIIGHCHRTVGDTRRAYKEYRKSFGEDKYNNAVLWHIAVLLRSKIRGQNNA